jgi:hypothetical protein
MVKASILHISVFIFIFFSNACAEIPGKVLFIEIKQLPAVWWKEPERVWDVWDTNTYYLWGANRHNCNTSPRKRLRGSGLASKSGPTRGRGHTHYVGIITTSLRTNNNDRIFSDLENKLKSGSSIVFPVIKGRCALGTGVAFRRYGDIKNWYRSQKYLFEKVIGLFTLANEIEIEEGVYWPDCGESMKSESTINFQIRSIEDIQDIIHYLDTKIAS